MNKIKLGIIVIVLAIVGLGISTFLPNSQVKNITNTIIQNGDKGGPAEELHPLSIEALRKVEYPGSDLVIEQTLDPGSNYKRYIVSYKSEGLKIYALLTIPNGTPPAGGFPAIVFNHGYIPPDQYRTTERYIAYTDAFSSYGYVLLRPDYRGHGNSEGEAEGGYGSNDYTIDVLNALSSLKKHESVNSEKIGMWGHSMGGHITMRSMVVDPSIKAGVIWAGVVGPYPDLFLRNQGSSLNPDVTPRPSNFPQMGGRRSWRTGLTEKYGSYEENKEFWDSLSAVGYASELSGPVQFHHGTNDSDVPVGVSEYVEPILAAQGKSGGLFVYPGDDHDITNNFGIAMQRSIEFFDKYLK